MLFFDPVAVQCFERNNILFQRSSLDLEEKGEIRNDDYCIACARARNACCHSVPLFNYQYTVFLAAILEAKSTHQYTVRFI